MKVFSLGAISDLIEKLFREKAMDAQQYYRIDPRPPSEISKDPSRVEAGT